MYKVTYLYIIGGMGGVQTLRRQGRCQSRRLQHLWCQLVLIMKPMSDLCWVCQQNSMAIMRAANTPEAEKTQVRLYQSY